MTYLKKKDATLLEAASLKTLSPPTDHDLKGFRGRLQRITTGLDTECCRDTWGDETHRFLDLIALRPRVADGRAWKTARKVKRLWADMILYAAHKWGHNNNWFLRMVSLRNIGTLICSSLLNISSSKSRKYPLGNNLVSMKSSHRTANIQTVAL